MPCTLSLINYSPFYIVVRSAIVAMEISHRAVFVAISGCAMHNIAPAVASVFRACMKVLWLCGGISLWVQTAANQIIFRILDTQRTLSAI